MTKENEIINYFDSVCRIIVKESNYLMENMDKQHKKDYVNSRGENDFVFKLGKSFGELARFPTEGSKGKDIYIDKLDFEISVKYWRNWVGKSTNKTLWIQSIPLEVKWLFREIEQGNKGKKAIICGWGTAFEWREILQLGCKTGSNPLINESKINNFLPFLMYSNSNVSSVVTRYNYKEGTLLHKNKDVIINWRLFGDADDSFNIVVYW